MGVIAIPDFGNVSRNVATKVSGGVHFQNTEQPISTFHYVNDGTDNVNVVASAAYLRAIRVFNNAGYAVFAKLHNTAGAPTIGAGVVYAVGAQAGQPNGDPRLSGGGRYFSAGIGLSLVRELADSGPSPVDTGLVLVEIEYEQYT